MCNLVARSLGSPARDAYWEGGGVLETPMITATRVATRPVSALETLFIAYRGIDQSIQALSADQRQQSQERQSGVIAPGEGAG